MRAPQPRRGNVSLSHRFKIPCHCQTLFFTLSIKAPDSAGPDVIFSGFIEANNVLLGM